MTTRRWLVVLAGVTGMTLARAAYAEPFAARSEAAERYDRAIRLVNAGDLSGGLAEFRRVYALVPSAVVLYDLGLLYAELQRPVDAARALGKALSDPTALKPAEVEHARRVLREQRDRIGLVALSTNVQSGTVELDNVEVATLPLMGPLEVSGGPHVVGVISSGFAPVRREVVVAGGETISTHLELVAIEGLLAHIAVQSRVPVADVYVDGERVGKTPLESTISVAPGTHQVEVRRAGYTTLSRQLTLQGGARGELSFTLAVDRAALSHEGGTLAIEASETEAVVSIDGDEVGVLAGPIELPRGAHRLHVERGGFLPAERDVDVPLGGTATVSVAFEPTPDTRVRYVAGAHKQRTWGWATAGVGAALVAGGTILAVLEGSRLASARDQFEAVKQDYVWMSGRSCDFSMGSTDPSDPTDADRKAACAARFQDASSAVNQAKTLRTVGWVTAGVGGAALVTGLVLLLTADDPNKYNERPAERKMARWKITPAASLHGISLFATTVF